MTPKQTYRPTTLQSHESMDHQPDHRGDGSLDLSSSADVPSPQTQPTSAPGEDVTPDIVTMLHAFSRLPLAQRRALLPVLSTITATSQPSELITSDASGVSAPP